MKKAEQRYGDALPLINDAIQTPDQLSQDSTLVAVLLLDLFEKMTNDDPFHTKSWVSHVNGAFALVQLRGRHQFSRPIGLKILLRICTNLLISCVASHRPIPLELTRLRAEVEPFLDSNDPKWRLMNLMVGFVELRYANSKLDVNGAFIIESALKLDMELENLATSVPFDWQPRLVSVKDRSERILEDYFDIYRDLHATQTWNTLRSARILINEIILDRCLDIQCDDDLEGTEIIDVSPLYLQEMAVENINKMGLEICASAPQYTTLVPSKYIRNDNRSLTEVARNDQIYPLQSVACYTLLYPLYIAARSESSNSAIKEWVSEQYRFMSATLGIQNADKVLKALEQGQDRDPWSVYAMLGGYAFVA